MSLNKKKFILLLVFIITINFLSGKNVYAQSVTLSGKVFNNSTKKPVDFGTVIILEARVKANSQADGSYFVVIPKPGEYTVMVRSQGLRMFKEKIKIDKNITRDFNLDPLRLRGDSLVITDDRYVQKVSRRTMTVEELKSTPASFGDAVNALTSLPGVDRTDGFFGPLTIRGMHPDKNMYYVDGMPINNPLHFGGLHSVINTNLMDKIDLYASAFPSQFGGPIAAVIDIKTKDTVKETAVYSDISLLSATALLQKPISREVYDGEKIVEEQAGYYIVSGRYGYIAHVLPIVLRNADIEILPEYYDYQFKAKYYFDRKHSVKMLFIGAKDKFKLVTEDDTVDLEEGDDPLFNDVRIDTDDSFNNLGLYYTYRLDRVRNEFMVYGALTKHESYVNSNNDAAADWIKDYNQEVKPYIYGIKDTVYYEWIKNHAELRANVEYTYYYFKAEGDIWSLNEYTPTEQAIDLGDENAIRKDELDLEAKNHLIGGYIDNKFTYGGLTFIPGVRADYLKLVDQTTVDPRAMISYEFETETTISVAGGRYSSFFQTNPFLFGFRPDLVEMDYSPAERAVHSVVGIEQVIDQFTIGVETYYNYFYDQAVQYPHFTDNGEWRAGQGTGKVKTYGFEIMLRKEKEPGTNDYFGWLSYTFNRSKEKSGITGNVYDPQTNVELVGVPYDPNGDKWKTSDYDRTHALKLVLGYTWGKHTISGKFQLYTSLPYTPITDGEADPDYPGRYTPVFSEDKNSERFPLSHRLDLRYTYKTNYEWGYISWYIEVINAYGHKPISEEEWKYNKPYSSSNPQNKESEELDSLIIPNFGVEVKF